MRLGFVGTSGHVRDMIDLAVEVEEHGWDGFFTWDGVSLDAYPSWDPWTLLGAAAVRTSRVRLGAVVFAPARRSPWTLAKQVQTVDHLSGGRLVLPVGLGVTDDGAFRIGGPMSARERAERLDDALAFLDLASDGGPVTFAGKHHTVAGMALPPGTVQRPRVPVWVVGAWPSRRSLARAARWDGIVLQLLRSDAEVTPGVVREVVAALTDLSGGLPAGYDVVLNGRLPDDPGAAAELLAGYAEAGATWWIEADWTPGASLASQQARVRQGPPRVGGGS